MRKRLVAVLSLLLAAGSVSWAGDGNPAPALFRKTFSLEMGAGCAPLHMYLMHPSRDMEKELALEGKEASGNGSAFPALSLSGAWRYSPRSEFVFTAGIAWTVFEVTQYEPFGVNPRGGLRYNLDKGHPAGLVASGPVGTGTFQWRMFWNPSWKVQPYTAVGFGFTTDTYMIPLPSLVPVGVRFGGRHLYCFAEMPLSPVSFFCHGGLGWHF